jgi:hypothetical protein
MKIKKLEWFPENENSWRAETPFWDYQIKRIRNGMFMAWNQEGEKFHTFEEAMEWFQNTFEETVKECFKK